MTFEQRVAGLAVRFFHQTTAGRLLAPLRELHCPALRQEQAAISSNYTRRCSAARRRFAAAEAAALLQHVSGKILLRFCGSRVVVVSGFFSAIFAG